MDHFVILTEHVVEFNIGFEPPSTDRPLAINRKVVGVPGLNIVVDRVLLLAIPFSDINEGVIESVVVSAFALPVEARHHTTAMKRDIRNLVAVIGIVGIGDIDGFLVRIREPRAENKAQRKAQRHVRLGIYAVDLHRSEIEHRPSELLALWVRYDLIRHAVIVVRDRNIQRGQTPSLSGRRQIVYPIRDLYRVLARQLRTKIRIAQIRVIEIIEGREPVTLLVERIERQIRVRRTAERQRTEREEEAGGEFGLLAVG